MVSIIRFIVRQGTTGEYGHEFDHLFTDSRHGGWTPTNLNIFYEICTCWHDNEYTFAYSDH